jgi:hypothetical protein
MLNSLISSVFHTYLFYVNLYLVNDQYYLQF